jgi:vitamin B12 transporter
MHRFRIPRFRILLILAPLICRVAAQTGLEETVIVSANAAPVPFASLSRKVTVLTRDEIERLPVRSIDDLLRHAAGVEVRARGPFGVQSDFSVRGAGFGQVLFLVDGVRMNNAQTGHHNSDFPLTLNDVERVEILHGSGSSLHGADAFGGTVNIVTRRDRQGLEASLSAGQFGLLDARAAAGWGGDLRQDLTVRGTRSSGFMFNRDFRVAGILSQTRMGERGRVLVSHLDKAFGADGFYGPSPSREWTNQTLARVDRDFQLRGGPRVESRLWYRTHGDRFLWDIHRPGFAENFHRTHAAAGQMTLHGEVSDRLRISVGTEIGGDWIRSSNLGDHSFRRSSVFTEVLHRYPSGTLAAGLRYDHYSNFGGSASPAVSGGWWVVPGLKLRTSLGRAFRVPTFTELYYRDPNHEASPLLDAEKAWEAELGADWFPATSWMAQLTVFSRRDRDLIDWVRPGPEVPWRTSNIRRLHTQGLEFALQRFFGAGGLLRSQYSYLSSTTRHLDLDSKYALDFPRHSWTVSSAHPLVAGIHLGSHLSFRRKADGRSYWLADCRLSRRFRDLNLFLEATNLTDSVYQEIKGVDMPGRWIRAGVDFALAPP